MLVKITLYAKFFLCGAFRTFAHALAVKELCESMCLCHSPLSSTPPLLTCSEISPHLLKCFTHSPVGSVKYSASQYLQPRMSWCLTNTSSIPCEATAMFTTKEVKSREVACSRASVFRTRKVILLISFTVL